MQVLLFDIDGTLLFSGGAGQVAMKQTLLELYGEAREVDIPVHGRTDKGIIADLLEAHEVAASDAEVARFYSSYAPRMEAAMKVCDGSLLPGVRGLLDELAQVEELVLGLLTGNGEVAAKAKLAHFDIDHYFHFGGFGENFANRNDIAVEAKTSARRVLTDANISEYWVIGDTIHDVACARHIDAKSIAVGTGRVDQQELIASDPTFYITDLSEFSQVQMGMQNR